MQISKHNDAALLWLACVAALCAGCYVAFGLLGAAIDLEHDRAGRVSAILLGDEQILAQRPALERQERAIDVHLRSLRLRADKPTTVARFIRAVARIAAARRVELIDIDERAAPIAPVAAVVLSAERPAEAAVDRNALEAIPLDVTLRGTYRSLLATICELAQEPLTMQIEIASIERGAPADDAPGGPLSARLHVDLERLSDPQKPLSQPAPF